MLDPYFSGSKIEWLLANRPIPVDDDLAVGTIDSWLLWNLTGGEVHATDPSNASRTMLFDITTLAWSDALCGLFGVKAQFGRVPVFPVAATPTLAARRPS